MKTFRADENNNNAFLLPKPVLLNRIISIYFRFNLKNKYQKYLIKYEVCKVYFFLKFLIQFKMNKIIH